MPPGETPETESEWPGPGKGNEDDRLRKLRETVETERILLTIPKEILRDGAHMAKMQSNRHLRQGHAPVEFDRNAFLRGLIYRALRDHKREFSVVLLREGLSVADIVDGVNIPAAEVRRLAERNGVRVPAPDAREVEALRQRDLARSYEAEAMRLRRQLADARRALSRADIPDPTTPGRLPRQATDAESAQMSDATH